MSPHAEHREAQARGLRACKKSISCVVKMPKDCLSRANAQAGRRFKPPTLLHETVPGPRQSDVDFGRVEGGDVMRCQAIQSFSIPVGSFTIHPWIRTRQLCTARKGDSSIFCTKKEGYLGVCQATQRVDSTGERLYMHVKFYNYCKCVGTELIQGLIYVHRNPHTMTRFCRVPISSEKGLRWKKVPTRR